MKPDWKNAPDWANYWAMDWNGQCCWYENLPVKDFSSWRTKDGMSKIIATNWEDSLEPRPSSRVQEDDIAIDITYYGIFGNLIALGYSPEFALKKAQKWLEENR